MKKRIYGLDFLRIFAMWLVVLDHTVIANLVGGNAFFHKNIFSATNAVMWLLFMLSIWCNVIFGMVSGYLMYTKKPKPARVFSIWLEVFFYSVVCFLFLAVVCHVPVTRTNLLNAIFPIIRVRYWYLTAYFEMLLFVPFLNLIVRYVSRQTALISLALFFILVITLPLFLNPHADPFALMTGKNAFGLMLFYLLGAFIRKFKFDQLLNKKGWWVMVVITLALGWLSKIAAALLDQNCGWHLNPNFLVKNTSLAPTTLVGAFAFFCIFKNAHFKKGAQRLLKLLSAASLGVYLLHWALIPILQYKMMVPGRDQMNPLLLLALLVLIALVIDLACSLIDLVRIYLFKLCRFDRLAQKVGQAFTRLLASFKAQIN